ncbi:hypothetical protein GJAV_G00228600, partial [Gymnothorax javanicus]
MLPYASLLLLASCSLTLASHSYSGTLTFTPKGRNQDGSFRVDFRFKQTLDECYHWNSWYCLNGHCGNADRFEIGEIDRSLRGVNYGIGQWCQSEALMTRNIPSNLPFEMWNTGCCWIFNSLSNHTSWRLMTHVDLGIRSDTGEPNRSPETTILPFIRIPQNCHRMLSLLAHDPDMDQVRCRYGNASENECFSCYQHPGFYLDQNSCTLSHKQNSSQNVYIFEIVLEDYPRQQITLSYTDGSLSIKSPLVTRHPAPKLLPKLLLVVVEPAQYYIWTQWWWWWWNQPSTTSGPQWRNQPYSTPSPWWWNQPISHVPYSWNQPSSIPPTQGGQQFSTLPSSWWYTPPPNSPLLSTSTYASGPHNQHWWAWLTTTKATTSQPLTAWHWQMPTTTTHVPTPTYTRSTGPLSKIPLQFSIQVDPSVHSCIDGEILPQFLYPTPNNGEILNASVDQELEIGLKATATQSWWTPNENDFGDHVPICFIAESSSGSRIFHSQMRCIIVIVGHTYGKANVVCNETTMTVEVEKSSIISLQEDHLHLNDPTCTPMSNSTHVIAAVSLNSCGTRMEEDANNLIFKNEIVSYDKPNAVITRKRLVEIGFSCTYPKKGDVSLEFRAHRTPFVFTEKGFGKFTYQFEFFQSSLFNNMVDPKSYPIVVALGEMLFMEIKATSSVTNTELFVESYRATPVDDPNYHIYYDILRN